MIGRLTGRLIECTPGRILLDVAGVGYELLISLQTYYSLAGGDAKSPVSLHVHTHVREDALQLYGFSTLDERAAFAQLIGISGIGPRLGLAILSGIGVDELRTTVVSRDRSRLEKIPGVGKKTAERLLLELRHKMSLGELDSEAAVPRAAGSGATHRSSGLRLDAISALVNLGYTRQAAAKAVDHVVESEPQATELEKVLRGALQRLVR